MTALFIAIQIFCGFGMAGLCKSPLLVMHILLSISVPLFVLSGFSWPVYAMGFQGRVLWMDATANIKTLQTREGVKKIISKCKQANINSIVLDVKPIIGEVMYKSYVAPKLSEWKGEHYPKDYDLLQTVLEEAHGKAR